MAKLLVRDKNGVEREVTKRAYELVGNQYGYVIIGEVKTPTEGLSEVQRVMQELKEKKAADEKQKLAAKFVQDQQAPQVQNTEPEEVIRKGKPGRKPKTK